MAIEFHCQHCNKLVRAPGNAGGRRAKCPACHQEVYIPTPPDKIEELELAPVDEDWRDRKRRLDAEAKKIRDALRQETGVPEGAGTPGGESGIPGTGTGAGSASSHHGVEALVIEYLVAMSNSQLERAEALRRKLAARADQAKNFAQQLSIDPMPPPELANLGPGVLKGLLKGLLSEL